MTERARVHIALPAPVAARWRRPPPPRGRWAAWGVAAVLVAALAVPPKVDVGGIALAAREVVVLVDVSGSMAPFQARKDSALAALHAGGIATGEPFAIQGSASGIVEAVETAFAARPGADAVWIVSDFYDGTDLVYGDDARRWERLLALLRARGARLYLSTVEDVPPPDHLRLVEATGGRWARFVPR